MSDIEILNSLADAFEKYPDAVLSHAQMGNCMVCGDHKDLRCGACFNCCGKVSGEPIKNGHRLWETEKPDNTWYTGN